MSYPRWSLAEVRRRPGIRINQTGYLPELPITATVISTAGESLPVTVLDGTGRRIGAGATEPWPQRPEPSSGEHVHRLRLPSVGPAPRARLVIAGEVSHEFSVSAELYRPLATDALAVLTLMRSGQPIDESLHPDTRWHRPAGHRGVAPNTGDTAVAAVTGQIARRWYPGWECPGLFDVSGGWYDAGDYGKYVTSGALAAWHLCRAALDADQTVGRWRELIVRELRWQLDWLLRMQVPIGKPLAGMAFHRVHGEEWSPVPGLPHLDPTVRVLHRPSTPATLQLAAVTAAAARLFAPLDAAYSARLLNAARTAFAAADHSPTLLPPDDHCRDGGGCYADDDATDDAYWAAVELWLSTGEPGYRDRMRGCQLHADTEYPDGGYDLTSVQVPATIDLALDGPRHQQSAQQPSARAARELDRGDVELARERLRHWADQLMLLQHSQPWGMPYYPSSWGWGSNGVLLNNLTVLIAAYRAALEGGATLGAETGQSRRLGAIAEGMDYLLGRNALGHSYICGYGTDSSRCVRSRLFGAALDPQLPPAPPGLLVGGANSQPSPDFPYDDRLVGLPPQCCYLDEPTSEVTNDHCIRWNAALVQVCSFLGLCR